MSLHLVTWNVQWATPRSPRRTEILDRIDRARPEVVCLTETHTGLLSQQGHSISSQPDYGYPIHEGRRKVMLWSREPWEHIDNSGHDAMPPGPLALRSALQEAFPRGMRIATSELDFEGRRSIDHVALTDDLEVESLDVINNKHDLVGLSDHFGVVAQLSARDTAP